ncbi:MAG: zincin-like metallopeptidase domain-containing protein, partial [Lawsonibacter sp.]
GVPEWKQDRRQEDISFLKASRDVFLSNLGVDFREGGYRACYLPVKDCIILPRAEDFTGAYAYVCTLLHEAGHATGHSSRLDRPMNAPLGSPEYAKEELRAEIASAFTAQALGLTLDEGALAVHIKRHKAYIQSWIAVLEQDPNQLFAAIKDADQITDYLMEHGRVLELGRGSEAAYQETRVQQAKEAGEEWEP